MMNLETQDRTLLQQGHTPFFDPASANVMRRPSYWYFVNSFEKNASGCTGHVIKGFFPLRKNLVRVGDKQRGKSLGTSSVYRMKEMFEFGVLWQRKQLNVILC